MAQLIHSLARLPQPLTPPSRETAPAGLHTVARVVDNEHPLRACLTRHDKYANKRSAMLAMLTNGLGNGSNNNAPLEIEKGVLPAKLNDTLTPQPATSSAVAETVFSLEGTSRLHRAPVIGGVSDCAAAAATTSSDIGDLQRLRRRSQTHLLVFKARALDRSRARQGARGIVRI